MQQHTFYFKLHCHPYRSCGLRKDSYDWRVML